MGASKVSVLYIYIDNSFNTKIKKKKYIYIYIFGTCQIRSQLKSNLESY